MFNLYSTDDPRYNWKVAYQIARFMYRRYTHGVIVHVGSLVDEKLLRLVNMASYCRSIR